MEKQILDLFLFNETLRFNEIEKKTKIRSNKLDYHLKKLIKKGIIAKNHSHYSLTENSEFIIPYLSSSKAVVPVVIIHVGNKKEAFLVTRSKRPYKGMLGMPGGRLLIGEGIDDSVKRIMKNKYNLGARLIKINSISIEHVRKGKRTIHSFLLIFVSAKPEIKISLLDIEKNKNKMIPSDYYLLKNNLGHKQKIGIIASKAR